LLLEGDSKFKVQGSKIKG